MSDVMDNEGISEITDYTKSVIDPILTSDPANNDWKTSSGPSAQLIIRIIKFMLGMTMTTLLGLISF